MREHSLMVHDILKSIVLSASLLAGPGLGQAFGQSSIAVEVTVRDDGQPTQEWRDALLVFHSVNELDDAIADRHPLTEAEHDWVRLISDRAARWSVRTASLTTPFEPVDPPEKVQVVLGNVAGQDAFTPSPTTIAFDVARLQELYGNATSPSSADRIDRFFDHEYTHLLHKAWHRVHPIDLSTPLLRALWDCLVEGIGNYRSLSARWKGADGGLSDHARDVLGRLQPVFVDRIAALATANEDQEAELVEGLSMGPFEQKWGALTVALWMFDEAGTDDGELAQWVNAGPEGILTLARRHLPAELAAQLP
jgi:hypothetical protein